MSREAALHRAIDLVGGQTKLAQLVADFLRSEGEEDVKLSQGHIQYWVKTGKVPAEYARPIEMITNKQVLRYELRPDIYPPEEFRLVVESAENLQAFLKTLHGTAA